MGKTTPAGATLDRAQIKSSLEAHNASFDELLKHIPAKHYIRPDSDDEDARPEQPKGKLTKAQRKALAKAKQDEELRQAKNDAKRKARLARYDPDEPKTIAEIQAAKLAGKGKKRAAGDASDDDDGEDSSDGEMNGQEWREDGGDDEVDSPNETDFADSDDEDGDIFELDAQGVIASKAGRKGSNASDAPAPTITELREKLARRIADIQAQKRATKAGSKAGALAGNGGEAGVEGGSDEEDDDEDEDEDEDEDGEGEVRSKDDLLAERRRRAALRDNRRKKLKERMKQEKSEGAKKRANEPSNGRKGGGKANAGEREHDGGERASKRVKGDDSVVGEGALVPHSGAAVASTSTSTDPSSLTFSNFDFATYSERTADAALTPKALKKMQAAAGTLKKNRHALPKDANQALEILQKRKERLEALDPEKREKKEDKERWEKVLLKAEGEKVRDDETRLKKMAKRQEREKRKSAKAWSDRKATVEKTISDKVAKRNANLAARKQAVKDKKMGVKKSKTAAGGGGKKISTTSGKARSKGRPGFEGGGRKKK